MRRATCVATLGLPRSLAGCPRGGCAARSTSIAVMVAIVAVARPIRIVTTRVARATDARTTHAAHATRTQSQSLATYRPDGLVTRRSTTNTTSATAAAERRTRTATATAAQRLIVRPLPVTFVRPAAVGSRSAARGPATKRTLRAGMAVTVVAGRPIPTVYGFRAARRPVVTSTPASSAMTAADDRHAAAGPVVSPSTAMVTAIVAVAQSTPTAMATVALRQAAARAHASNVGIPTGQASRARPARAMRRDLEPATAVIVGATSWILTARVSPPAQPRVVLPASARAVVTRGVA